MDSSNAHVTFPFAKGEIEQLLDKSNVLVFYSTEDGACNSTFYYSGQNNIVFYELAWRFYYNTQINNGATGDDTYQFMRRNDVVESLVGRHSPEITSECCLKLTLPFVSKTKVTT